uniref:Uncharacterized protein n=1 Tax=viral metagenome TaxID=1070528 RepID=A0A6C0F062_9ZZZZ
MAQPPTYQELMAEVFEENAKTVLVYQQEFEEEDAEPYEQEDYSDNELEDREEFNKFAGARNKPEHVIKPKASSTQAGKVSYNIDRHIRTYALNIDGRFRGSLFITKPPSSCTSGPVTIAATNSSNFLFNPSRQYKNVHSIRVTSFEFFNNFYTYSGIDATTGLGRGNTTLTITDLGATNTTGFTPVSYPITLENGNYVIVDPIMNPDVPHNLLAILQNHIRTLGGGVFADMTIQLNSFSSSVIFNSVGRQYQLDFPKTTDNPNGNGIGYNLGFYGNSYTSIPTTPAPAPYFSVAGNAIISESNYDSVEDTYVYLKINDYNIIKHINSDQTEFGAFLKIPLTSPKNSIQFMSSTTNTSSAEYFFPQPSNISSFLFEMVDAYGKTLQMNGSTFSVTLEIQEILQSDIYEKMLEL